MKILTHYECPLTGELFTHEDVVGYGNPPASPCTPVGSGSIPLTPIVTDVPDDDVLARTMKNYAIDVPAKSTLAKRDERMKELKSHLTRIKKSTQTKEEKK